MCLNKNKSIHFHVHVGLLSVFKWGFLCFPILGLSRVAKGGLQPHQRNTKRRKELRFSTMTLIHLFFFSFIPFLPLFLLLRIKEYPLINQRFSEPGGMCFSHTRMLVFSDHVCSLFFLGSWCV